MELRDYITIVRTHSGTFWITLIAVVVLVSVWQQSQPIKYQATLLLNIGRSSTQVTTNYTYDSFYRLQADERFADTVVRWLGSPRVVEDIYAATGIDGEQVSARDLGAAFDARRLSSHVIEVTYTDTHTETLSALSQKLLLVVNRYTESLNQDTKESNWFVVLGGDPVIRDARASFRAALVVSIAAGIFLGFWMTLLKNYFSINKK